MITTTHTANDTRHALLVPVQPKPAGEPGALDGYEAVCSCGYKPGSLFENAARRAGLEHANYMNAKLGLI
jgi:hypothetical protein